MKRRVISHEELDRRLDRAAVEPERFEELARDLADQLDRQSSGLEVTDPSAWRRTPSTTSERSARPSLRQQFRMEVDAIVTLDREAEAQLARRIEFARLRLDRALEGAGLTREDLEAALDPGAFQPEHAFRKGARVPAAVRRRWTELQALRVEMVERNLYLVLINVERYSHTTASQTDLIQEGAAALFRAVDGFDWRRGLLFRTYAVHWLNQAFRSYLYNFSHTVRVPVYLQKAMKHINDAKSRLGDDNASVEQIARQTDLGENLVATALWAARSSYSLDVDLDDDGDGGRLRDVLVLADDEGPYSAEIEDVSLEDSVDQALDRLSDRERFVVRMRFGIGEEREHTLAEVAHELGVSLERVRQIQVRAINKMRTPGLRRVAEPFLN